MDLVLLSRAPGLKQTVSEDVALLDGVQEPALLLVVIVLLALLKVRCVRLQFGFLPREDLLDQGLVDGEVLVRPEEQRGHPCQQRKEGA